MKHLLYAATLTLILVSPVRAQDFVSMCNLVPTDAVFVFALQDFPFLFGADTGVCPKACKAWVGACQKQGKGAAKCIETEVKNELRVFLAECKAFSDAKECKAFYKGIGKLIKGQLKEEVGIAKRFCKDPGVSQICHDFCRGVL